MKNLNLKNEIWLQKYIEDNKNDLIYIEQYYIKWYKVITEIISKE